MVAIDTSFTAQQKTVTVDTISELRTLLSRSVVAGGSNSKASSAPYTGAVGSDSGRVYIEGELDPDNTTDYYTFRVDGTSGTFQLTNDTDSRILDMNKTNIKILDSKGNVVIDSAGTSAEAIKNYGDLIQGNYSGFTKGTYTIAVTRRGTASSDTAAVAYNFNLTNSESAATFFYTKEIDSKTGDDQQIDNERVISGTLGGALSEDGDTAEYDFKVTTAGTIQLQPRTAGTADLGTLLNQVNVKIVSTSGKTIVDSASSDSTKKANYQAFLDGTLQIDKGSYRLIVTRKDTSDSKYTDIPFDEYLSYGKDTSKTSSGARNPDGATPAEFTDLNPTTSSSSTSTDTVTSGLSSILSTQISNFNDWMNGTGDYSSSSSSSSSTDSLINSLFGSSSSSSSSSSTDFTTQIFNAISITA